MPHLVIEVSRGSLERKLLTIPIPLEGPGKPADILAPPKAIQYTMPTPGAALRMQIIVNTVELQAVPGSSQCKLNLYFDEGSVEVLSTHQSEGLLKGLVSVSFSLGFVATTVSGGQIAQLSADFSGSVASLAFDAVSKLRLAEKLGALQEKLAETLTAAFLTGQFRSLGAQPTGFNMKLTPGLPSEDLFTVDALPGITWLDPETLALSLQYAPEPVPAPFQPVPFLPAGKPTALGLRLSNDGFQRTVRNPAARKLARDMLSERLIDGFVQQVYHERGGVGDPTDGDRAEGQKRLNDYLNTPKGLADLANETPAPTGNGKLRKHIKNVPNPFSDFDVEIPNLDLWLGTDRIEGSARATGEVNSIGFTVNIRFRARPVLITSPKLSIEMQDLKIDDPDVDIDLPAWLEWASGILVGVFAGLVFGALVGFLLSSVVSALVEVFIPSDLANKVPKPDPKAITGLPPGVSLNRLTVVPDHLEMLGNWYVYIDDPRPFFPMMRIVHQVSVTRVPLSTTGTAWFVCLGMLGIVTDSRPGLGTPFEYVHNRWRSFVTASLESESVPLPLTRFPWTISIGYRLRDYWHTPVITVPAQPLTPGLLTVTADVWHPEPPLGGKVGKATFTIQVDKTADDTYTFSVPPQSGCIFIDLETKSIDAMGNSWNTSAEIDVINETVVFGSDFDDFSKSCAGQGREIFRYKAPSLRDQVWNPPDVYQRIVQEAIRTQQPGITADIDSLIEAGGQQALQLILAPSLTRGGPSQARSVSKRPATKSSRPKSRKTKSRKEK